MFFLAGSFFVFIIYVFEYIIFKGKRGYVYDIIQISNGVDLLDREINIKQYF